MPFMLVISGSDHPATICAAAVEFVLLMSFLFFLQAIRLWSFLGKQAVPPNLLELV